MEVAGVAFSVAQSVLAALSYPPLQEMFTIWGYHSELKSLTSDVSIVSTVLRDAPAVDEEKLSNRERNLIEKLKEAVYDADDLLDEFATLARQEHQLCMEAIEKSLKKVQPLVSRFKELKLAYSMSRKVKDIKQKLDHKEEDHKVVGGTSSNDFGNSGSDDPKDPKIKEIRTTNMWFLNFLPMVAFKGLTKMTIYWDDNVERLLEVEEVFRSCSSSLRSLKVKDCRKLRSVSRGLQHLTALESLELVDLPELRFDETQGEGEKEEEEKDEDDNTGKSMPWRCLAQCLRSLTLSGLHEVVELPKGMRYLTALQSLKIKRLPLKDLPEWTACLPSLHSLEIKKCEGLKSLPEALEKLNSQITSTKSLPKMQKIGWRRMPISSTYS